MLERQQMTPEEKRRRASEKTILIVEDNELNMKLFHDLLDAHGYKTLQTRNGMEALALAREHRPDLILMDIQLPEVSGLEVTKWLKEDDQLRTIPVIAVTAFADARPISRSRFRSRPFSTRSGSSSASRDSGENARIGGCGASIMVYVAPQVFTLKHYKT